MEGVRAVFDRLGSIQFDPLGVAGRNHDLVLHARVADYEPAWTEALLYGRRELFETYNKGLSLLPTSELPWHRDTWHGFAAIHADDTFAKHSDTMVHVLERLRDDGPLSSLDFHRRQTVDWYWGPTSEVRAVLEALAEAGVISLAHRDGNRRYYDLTERLYPTELLEVEIDERDRKRHKLLSRYRAHGLLGAGGQSELWFGIGPARRRASDPPELITRSELRAELIAGGELTPVDVEGVKGERYILGAEVGELREAQRSVEVESSVTDPSVVFLAPLDPLVWDRNLLRSLFEFDYVWEVYVPEAKRRWGYYVLPILWGDRLVGRIEPRIDRDSDSIRILDIWWQDGFRPRQEDGFVEAMREALGAYARFGGVRRLDWGDRSAEKRLFGAQARRT
jgi:uncharacterized protein YcaQ